MDELVPDRSGKTGNPPGTPVHVGEKRMDEPRITVFRYDEDGVVAEETVDGLDDVEHGDGVMWLNIDGLHDTELIERAGEEYGLHPLTREDIANTDQRPKLEDYEDYLFVVLKMLRYDEDAGEVNIEQVSCVLTDSTVISFQEAPGDVFDRVRERIRGGKGRIRKMGADYLLYALMDAIVDNYFAVVERIGDDVEEIETEIVSNPDPATLQDIHRLKRELIYLRKGVWPLREVVSGLERSESGHISEETRPYLRDLYDHTIQIIDIIETFRDMVSGTLDVYLSSISNRMNEVMKVLTIVATIFIPLTFIAGVYGMNFDTAHPLNMPELTHPLGYPATLLVMAVIAAGMLVYFRKRGWL